jgi:hypothetical protein
MLTLPESVGLLAFRMDAPLELIGKRPFRLLITNPLIGRNSGTYDYLNSGGE